MTYNAECLQCGDAPHPGQCEPPDTVKVTEIPLTWEQAYAVGLLPMDTLQMAVQFFGGLPEGNIKESDYTALQERLKQ